MTLDRALAEDLTQETMIRAMQRIGQYQGRSRFSTWLISIATHLFLDELRRRSRETLRFEALARELPAAGEEGALNGQVPHSQRHSHPAGRLGGR